MRLFGLYAKDAPMDGAQNRWNYAVHHAHPKVDELTQVRPKVIPRESKAPVIRYDRRHLPLNLLDGILDGCGSFLGGDIYPWIRPSPRNLR
jgi:hypothetical protein